MRKKKVVTVVKKPKSLFGILFGGFSILSTLGLSVFMALGAAGQVSVVKQTCTVIYNNYNAKVLYKTEVKEGDDSVYPYPAPTKPPDGERTYSFAGWFPSDKNIQENPTICFPLFIPSDLDISELADSLFDKIDLQDLLEHPEKIDDLEKLLNDLNLPLPDGVNLNSLLKMDLLTFKTPKGGNIYLRTNSYGEFTFEDGVAKYRFAPEYKAPKNDKILNPLNYTAALTGTSFTKYPINLKYKLKKEGYNLPSPLYTTTDATFKYSNNDSYQLGASAPSEYTTDYVDISCNPEHISNLLQKTRDLTTEELEERRRYNQYAYDTYTNVPTSGELPQLLDKYLEGISKDSPAALFNISMRIYQKIKQTAAPDIHSGIPNPVEKMLKMTEPTGNSNHFASLCTYMCRRLGIPARVVDGFLIKSRPNVETKVGLGNMHRWCEAYLDDIGWIALDPWTRMEFDRGDDEAGDEPLNIEIENQKPGEYVDKTYDGSPFNVNFKFDELQLRAGDELRYNKEKLENIYQNGIYKVKLKFYVWDTYFDKDVSELYKFEPNHTVAFKINLRPIKITTPSFTFSLLKDSPKGYPYVGELDNLARKYKLADDNSLPKNDKLKFEHKIQNIQFMDIPFQEGEYDNIISSFDIYKYTYDYDNEFGTNVVKKQEDVKSSFDVITDFGTIKIVKE